MEISSIRDARWSLLVVDKNSKSLRRKSMETLVPSLFDQDSKEANDR